MLLEEVNAHHEGTYDFFYLPIDFKNRCNVGYCFVNFLDQKFIPAFVKEFNGQRWKSFNSEKVCAVSFARIQGKQAMIARFQNSSLLEKDDEYKPLLFYSSGPDKGKPEPFPVGTGGNKTHNKGISGLSYLNSSGITPYPGISASGHPQSLPHYGFSHQQFSAMTSTPYNYNNDYSSGGSNPTSEHNSRMNSPSPSPGQFQQAGYFPEGGPVISVRGQSSSYPTSHMSNHSSKNNSRINSPAPQPSVYPSMNGK
jgi:hypothetical protein